MAKGYGRVGKQKGAGGQAGMMQQLQALQAQMEAAQEALALETTTASVGGGAVKVTMTGDQVCKEVIIDPDLLEDADAEMLQDLILSAVNMALDQSREMQSDRMGPLAGGIPGMGF